MDINSILIWHKFCGYNFIENTHSYYYYDKKVKWSVTQFLHNFYPEFDSETISKKYAEKYGLEQADVLAEWKKKGDISAISGTIIHAYLENAKRGKTFDIDYSMADKLNIRTEVEERVKILLPQAIDFHKDTLNKLFPIQLEYTVGLDDYIAGNVDMLCWNEHAQEFQIWDYKNVKQINVKPLPFNGKCFYPFEHCRDTNYVHYSMQLNIYKEIIRRQLGIQIGKCYLVQFNYQKKDNNFEIFECLDLQKECSIALDNLLLGKYEKD